MIATLFSTGQLNAPIGFIAALAVGFCFGLCLEKAGFGSSRRLSGIFYLTDMSVLKVMFTAMVTAAIGLVAAERMGVLTLDALYLMPTVYGAHAIGGVIFGLGFAMGGWCPGTAAVGVMSGRLDALVFLVGVVIGSIGFSEAYPSIQPLTTMGAKGVQFLDQTLGITKDQLLLGLTGMAVVMFWFSEVVERGPAIARPGVSRLFLFGFSAILCLACLFALNVPKVDIPSGPATLPLASVAPNTGSPGSGGAAKPGASPEETLLAGLQHGKDHMEPAELAKRLMAGDPSITLVDIRSKDEFDAFHLKGAVNVALADLPRALAAKRGQGIIVLYSNGMTHPAQARDALVRMGYANVYLLTGGLKGFFETVLKPASLREGPFSPAEAATIVQARKFFLPESLTKQAAPGLLTPPGSLPGLVDASWLAANLGKTGLKIIDLRPQPQYNSGHIPGSFALNIENLRGNQGGLPSMLMPAPMLARQFGQMGIGPRDLVVIATAQSPHDATYVAMALERLGHKRYAILDGGMKTWVADKLPMDTALPRVKPVNYPAPEGSDSFSVAGFEVQAAMAGGRTLILDVRPADYFTGAKSDEARPGHIPGAVNRPFTDDQASAAGEAKVLKPVEELAKAYAAVIPGKDAPVIVHCRTGHQASQTWWVLTRLLGYTNVKYYDAGWTEWAARPDWPAVTSQPDKAGEKKQ